MNHRGSVELAKCGYNDLAVGCLQVCELEVTETTIESINNCSPFDSYFHVSTVKLYARRVVFEADIVTYSLGL